MKKLLFSSWLLMVCGVAFALPTVPEVQAEIQQGHYAQAEAMMREVVAAKPGSSKGHYLYAEILAHNGSFAKATEEASKAKQLDPEIKFTQPEKFKAFEALLEREQKAESQKAEQPKAQTRPIPRPQIADSSVDVAAQVPSAIRSSGIPAWVWVVGLAVVGYLLWRGFSRSAAASSTAASPAGFAAPNAPAAPSGAPGYGAAGVGGYGVQPGAGYPGPMAPQTGGLLRTGMAVAGGVAAGVLVDEMLHRNRDSLTGGTGSVPNIGGTDSLSNLQRAVPDSLPTDVAATELEKRDVDVGNGNDWDSGGDAGTGGDGADDGGWS